ncbi:MAG: hypothetical protein K2V38_00955 [Gemmataceae bacterium]|nr:hypothetical protein [Gemmataceae bacterium]
MSPEERKAWERGRGAAPFLDFVCVAGVSLIYLPALLAGVGLQRGSGRTLGLFGAAVLMLPCSPGLLLGLPVGIWGLIVLNNEDVKAALDYQPPEEDRRKSHQRRRRR